MSWPWGQRLEGGKICVGWKTLRSLCPPYLSDFISSFGLHWSTASTYITLCKLHLHCHLQRVHNLVAFVERFAFFGEVSSNFFMFKLLLLKYFYFSCAVFGSRIVPLGSVWGRLVPGGLNHIPRSNAPWAKGNILIGSLLEPAPPHPSKEESD